MEKPAKEFDLFALIIVGVVALAVWWYAYELTQKSNVTWAVGVLLAFASMHISKGGATHSASARYERR